MKKRDWIPLVCKVSMLLGGTVTSFAASEKSIERFNSTTSFYTSGNGGSVSTSVDFSTFYEGNSALKMNYALNGVAGNYVECFRSYGTSTLDLSYLPDKLSIMVKGSAGNNDEFRFMLYEDINMNGNPFEAGDEIWVFSNTSILANPNWTLCEMQYASFTKFGGGTGTIDLNRIGAWRLYITNKGFPSTKTVFFDQLKQITTHQFPTGNSALLKGSFIQLWNTAGCYCGQWSQAQWEEQMQKMKEVSMSKIVIQYGVYGDNAWYTPSSLSYVVYTNSTLANILNAAEKKGIDVYIGLYFDETWNTVDKSQPISYSALLTKHKQVADELWNLFGSNIAFKGWYIPQEINDLEWQSNTKRDLLANWLKDVSAYLKTKSAAKKVMIAPFFGPNMPADALKNWWESVLQTATNIDEIYPQDGVGTTTKDVDVDIPHYFEAIKTACTNKGRTFGATIESFRQTDGWPVNNKAFASVPADMARLDSQMVEASQFASEMIQFEWSYMQPSLSYATQKLYDDYKVWKALPTGTNDYKASFLKTDLYPNPSAFTDPIHLPDELEGCEYTLCDENGKTIAEGKILDKKINQPILNNSFLVLKVYAKNGVKIYKIGKF
jgi:hypothetical protein